MPEIDEALEGQVAGFELWERDARSRLEELLHWILILRGSFDSKSVDPLQKLLCPRAQLQRLALLKLDGKAISVTLDLDLIVVVEVFENIPAYLDLQHLYALLLEGYEALN